MPFQIVLLSSYSLHSAIKCWQNPASFYRTWLAFNSTQISGASGVEWCHFSSPSQCSLDVEWMHSPVQFLLNFFSSFRSSPSLFLSIDLDIYPTLSSDAMHVSNCVLQYCVKVLSVYHSLITLALSTQINLLSSCVSFLWYDVDFVQIQFSTTTIFRGQQVSKWYLDHRCFWRTIKLQLHE